MLTMGSTILIALQSIRLPFLTQLAALVSSLGNYCFIWVILALVMIFFLGRRDVGVTIVFTVLVASIVVGFILQPIFAQVRPCDAGIGVSAVMGVSRSGYSFPSFHATTSFAAATVIAMIAGRRWGTWAFAGAVLISLSRLYLGVEWPADVLVGAVLGVLIGILSSWVYNQFLHDILRDYPGTTRTKGRRTSVNASSSLRRKG